nr:retrovirus-related Pol polyprotein from transposon TNT 1-94 [Tanacetum cinerariifolium]
MQDTDEAEPTEVEEVIEVVTAAKLMTEVVTTAATTITVSHVPNNEAFARELEAELNENINWDDVMEQVKRREKQVNTVIRYQDLKRKPVTEAQARKNMMIYLKNMVGFKMDFFKGMTYNDIKPIFEKHYNLIRAFLEKGDKEIEEEGSKRKGNDDDDVYTEATPLALKVPVVDYQIHHEHNKPYYKIIRADGTHLLTPYTRLRDKDLFKSKDPHIVLSPNFNLLDESQVLLRVPRKNHMCNVDLKNVAPSGGLTCLFAKATLDESNLWHRRLGHINFKTMNKLAEAVNTSCYVQNRILVIKPHNKTLYELFHGRTPSLCFMRPFGCPVTILNTLDHLGKFDGKADEGFLVGYFMNRKAFKVFNSRTRIVEETLHITFLENKPNVAGTEPTWIIDIDTLTKSINYKPVVAGNQSNGSRGKARVKTVPDKDYILLPLWTQDLLFSSSSKDTPGDGFKPSGEEENKDTGGPGNKESEAPITKETRVNQEKDSVNNTNRVNAVSLTVNAASNKVNDVGRKSSIDLPDDPNMPDLEDISLFEDSNKDVSSVEADLNNMETTF